MMVLLTVPMTVHLLSDKDLPPQIELLDDHALQF